MVSPENLDQFIGKEKIIKSLRIGIKAAQNTDKSLDHILLYGPPGVGKTSLAVAISKELGVEIKIIQGANVASVSDLTGILSTLKKGDILFIDEIHTIKREIAEILYPALENKAIDLILGKGINKRNIRIKLSDFTAIAATTNLGDIAKSLEERFGYVFYLDAYSDEEIKMIIESTMKKMEIDLNKNEIKEIIDSCRGIPRNVMRILRRIKDYRLAQEKASMRRIIEECGFLYKGLTHIDIKYLMALKDGCYSLNSISCRINVDEKTITNKIEPFLQSNEWIVKSNKGRGLSEAGKRLTRKLVGQFSQ